VRQSLRRLPRARVARRRAARLFAARLFAVALVPAALIVPRVARAQGRLEGTVRDSAGAQIAGADVRVVGTRLSTVSGEDGTFHLNMVPSGTAALSVRRLGFAPDTVRVAVHDGATSTIGIVVREVARELPSVVVRAQRQHRYTGYLAGFYERRDRGFGRYITADDIAQRNPRQLSDMLRALPGIYVGTDRFGQTHLRLRGNTCAPVVFLDGTPAVAAEFDVDALSPDDVSAIEVYSGPASVPAEFVVPFGDTACGTIVIWTRHRDPPQRTASVTAEQLDSLVASLTVFTADQVDTPARADSSAPASPSYPDSLYRERVSGHVIAEFVVDPDGRARPRTIGMVSSTDPLFSSAVREAIVGARFIPARRHGMAVPQVVRQSFAFVIPEGLHQPIR
jgi:TonB family protein